MLILVTVILPLCVATIPSIITFLGVKAQLKADLEKNRQDREESKLKMLFELRKEREEELNYLIEVLSENNKKIQEALLCILRTNILGMYFKHMTPGNLTLSLYESENLHKLYDSYVGLGGNSFIHDIYMIMQSWPVVLTHVFQEDIR